jgi:hypothetical protein
VSAKNLPEMKRLSRSCDAYVELLLCTHVGAPESYRLHQLRLDGSALPCGRVFDRVKLLSHIYGPYRGAEASSWNDYIDDTEQGLLTNSYCRTTVQVVVFIQLLEVIIHCVNNFNAYIDTTTGPIAVPGMAGALPPARRVPRIGAVASAGGARRRQRGAAVQSAGQHRRLHRATAVDAATAGPAPTSRVATASSSCRYSSPRRP